MKKKSSLQQDEQFVFCYNQFLTPYILYHIHKVTENWLMHCRFLGNDVENFLVAPFVFQTNSQVFIQ